MRRAIQRPIVVSLIAVALAASFVVSAFPYGAAAPTSRVGTVSIGGITWTDDLRVTRNQASDKAPQVTVDAEHNAHIIWQSSRNPTGYYYVKMDRTGNFLSAETWITSHVLAGWGSTYPLGPTVDIDSNGNLHIVYDDGWENVKYQKIDDQGNVLVQEKNVGPQDGMASHTPSVAVGTDDTVHISHEEYKFQCEDIAYDKLDNNGGDIWIDRVVSSDVASHCEFSLVKADRYNGNIMFTFGSATGTWMARFNKFGVKDMSSVKIRTQSDLKIADVAATPNGNMHVVWSDSGKVLYSMVNASGVKVVDARTITSSGASNPGFPRIAATSDNRAVVVFDDQRSGSKEIYFAIIEPGHENDPVPPENIRLTDADGVASTDPWIAIDPDDNFHVVWVDSRDGNQEIYYKFAFNFALELYADPIDLASMFFIHPNETKRLPMELRNKGGLPDGYNIDLSFTQGADQQGWRISIDKTYVEQLGADETIPLNLTVRAPANARDGDNVSITVNASSASAPLEFDTIQFVSTVQVTRSVKLSVDNPVRYGDNGETVSFNLVVKNTGDVHEDHIMLEQLLGRGPDWPFSLDKSEVALDAGQATNFTAFVTIPVDAPGNFPGIFGVTAFLKEDKAINTAIQITVGVKAAFIIDMVASPSQRYVDPGETADFEITVTNVGNLPGQVQILVNAQQPAIVDFTAVLDREVIYLKGSEFVVLNLKVGVPANALAEMRLTLVVSGFSPQYAQQGQVEVTTLVNRVQGIDVSVSSGPARLPGRPVDYEVTVTNSGNGDETLQLQSYFVPTGWTMEFLDGAATINSIFVPHGQSKSVTARVTIGLEALSGTHHPTLALIDQFGGTHLAALTTNVVQFFQVDVTATEFKLDGSPGGRVEYDLQLVNDGNGPDNFTLTAENLPTNFEWQYYLVTVDQAGVPEKTPIDGVLAVPAHESRDVKLVLSVPLQTTARQVEFSGKAISQAQEEDAVILVVQIKTADLKPGVVTFTPNDPNPGQITAITVEVQNAGEIDAQPVVVKFYDNGQLISSEQVARVAAHQKGYVTFAWLPTAGTHDLRFEIDPLAGPEDLIGLVVETDETNNAFTTSKQVGGTQGLLPGFEAPMALGAIMAVLLVAMLRRRRDE